MARLTVDAIEQNRLYVLPHEESRASIRRRFERIDRTFEQQPNLELPNRSLARDSLGSPRESFARSKTRSTHIASLIPLWIRKTFIGYDVK